MSVNSVVDERTLREIYFSAFEAVVKQAKPWTVMCSYNQINGTFACENRWLLTDVLRGEWGFDGFVMSDWGGVHSTEKAALAGLDQESGQELDKQIYFGKPLADAVASGRVPEARLDEMAKIFEYDGQDTCAAGRYCPALYWSGARLRGGRGCLHARSALVLRWLGARGCARRQPCTRQAGGARSHPRRPRACPAELPMLP